MKHRRRRPQPVPMPGLHLYGGPEVKDHRHPLEHIGHEDTLDDQGRTIRRRIMACADPDCGYSELDPGPVAL